MSKQIPFSFCCANTGEGGDCKDQNESLPCDKRATNICTQCYLVQYCSRECQKAHWAIHKRKCKSPLMKPTWIPSWETENRNPSFMEDSGGPEPNNAPNMTVHGRGKYLFGNVPAIDVLNLKENEGLDTKKDLRLVFAASGDLRNAAKTVIGLPISYPGTCDLILNDLDRDIVIRNAILLLTALVPPPEEAAPMMLHLWYSALLPASMFLTLHQKILPLVQDVCTKIRGKDLDALQAKTWKFDEGKSSLRIILKTSQWYTLMQYFLIAEGLEKDDAQKLRKATTLTPERVDYLHRGLYALKPASRAGMLKFRSDGILLPFGASRKGFEMPNPTFFQSKDFWPMMDSADPLHGWPTSDIRDKVPLASNDLYGGLYFHVYDTLYKFCKRVKTLKLSFILLQVNALELADTLNNAQLVKQGFDRVEVANISDAGFIGIARTLFTLSSILHPKSNNPHATLLTLFINACQESNPESVSSLTAQAEIALAKNYMPLPPAPYKLHPNSVYLMELVLNRVFFWDLDAIFERYMKQWKFVELAKETGMCVKEKHTLVERWPMRLRKGATQEEFDVLRAEGAMGTERYVEWKRA